MIQYYSFFLSFYRLGSLACSNSELMWKYGSHLSSAPRKAATETGQEKKQEKADRHPCLGWCLSTVTEIGAFITAAVNFELNHVGWLIRSLNKMEINSPLRAAYRGNIGITNLRNSALLKKPPVVQLLKNIPTFYGA
jgi:hypothetical protein